MKINIKMLQNRNGFAFFKNHCEKGRRPTDDTNITKD